MRQYPTTDRIRAAQDTVKAYWKLMEDAETIVQELFDDFFRRHPEVTKITIETEPDCEAPRGVVLGPLTVYLGNAVKFKGLYEGERRTPAELLAAANYDPESWTYKWGQDRLWPEDVPEHVVEDADDLFEHLCDNAYDLAAQAFGSGNTWTITPGKMEIAW